ncbi:amidophosphoribosyltransferase [Candidatus Nomurabacteria bacterium RIFCSPLOWO2_01_FULL_42_17]|uniref:Amidophosphoribosyltransferase n=1 Tax=Candidatus Nomurabacteria bacterium RIFCSPLOWO2_01_FULL_42_17 TaxID=1801780 RepID=A0A1F6XMX2_9BACT|nr:MAG: amidophosphoribosyltransferase [Candidatus Nomurabacteria bacterium RIFCSPLOWO2_01_FULL_42_17]
MQDLNEKCGVFGIYSKDRDVSRISFFGLFALQHRGQEASGIAATDGTQLRSFRNRGLISNVFTEEKIKKLKGFAAIGHNRYSTSKGNHVSHAQPVIIDPVIDTSYKGGGIRANDGLLALAHNGNLPSTTALVSFLKSKNIPTMDDQSDSELMAIVIGVYLREGKTLPEAVRLCYPLFTGTFSLLVLTKNTLVAVRDHCGVRPLSLGKLDGGYVISSETCSFKTIGAEFLRDVLPGEMIIIDENGLESMQIAPANQKFDLFEFVYFARPDSNLLGKLVYEVRKKCGEQLAKEHPVKADIVVPVPETAIAAAIGYSNATGIPVEMALMKNRYIHRTFIEPEQHTREAVVKLKLNPLPEMLVGKRVVIIDDSIVRGTTSRQIVRELFNAGAKEVHFLVSSPPVKFPDFYGIDTPKQENLIGANKTIEEIKEFLGVTSLHYLSLEGLIASTGLPEKDFCTSCFTGEYPIDILERKKEVYTPKT